MLETNIRQRGNIGGSTVKLERRIKEFERIYGIHNGGNDKVARTANGETGFSQKDLAKQLGISVDTLQRAKTFANLPEEIQQMVNDGNISMSTASRLIAKLSPEQQEQLIATLPITEKLTQKQVQGYIDQLKAAEQEAADFKIQADKANLLKQKIV